MIKRIYSRLLAPCLAAVLLFSSPAHADIRTDNPDEIRRVQEYLTGLSTIAADFSQIAPDGTLTGGKFFLKRPGKMRWQYDPPTPILMVANGGEMIFFDYELEQLSHIPIDSTLANFLAREKIDLFDRFVTIDSFRKTPGMLRITIKETGKPEAGKITLEFSDGPLMLRNMIVTDSRAQVTTVALQNAQFGVKLDDKLFVFRDPRKKKGG